MTPDQLLTEGLLTDDELVTLGRIRIGLEKLEEATNRLNLMASGLGRDIRPIETLPIGLTLNDLVRIAKDHTRAEDRIRESAIAQLGGIAA